MTQYQIKNIKITDAKLCGECSTIQTSNFIHLTSAIYSPYDRGDEGMAAAFLTTSDILHQTSHILQHHPYNIKRYTSTDGVE